VTAIQESRCEMTKPLAYEEPEWAASSGCDSQDFILHTMLSGRVDHAGRTLFPVADGSEQTAQLTSESHTTHPAQSQSRADTIVIAIDHEFRIATPSNTSIPAATRSRPIGDVRSNTRPPATMRVYAANGRRT